jgi:hypothetical protein
MQRFSQSYCHAEKGFMKNSLLFCFFFLILISCHKDKYATTRKGCNIQQVYTDNAKKVTITNGIWGTVSNIEGDCMPTVPACSSCCRNCPVQRTVKIYQYTLVSNGVTSDPYKVFFDSFNTQLVTQVETDDNGFFQVEIPTGHYSIVIFENGKLYANRKDGQGGLNPFTLTTGTLNANLVITYKATF